MRAGTCWNRTPTFSSFAKTILFLAARTNPTDACFKVNRQPQMAWYLSSRSFFLPFCTENADRTSELISKNQGRLGQNRGLSCLFVSKPLLVETRRCPVGLLCGLPFQPNFRASSAALKFKFAQPLVALEPQLEHNCRKYIFINCLLRIVRPLPWRVAGSRS